MSRLDPFFAWSPGLIAGLLAILLLVAALRGPSDNDPPANPPSAYSAPMRLPTTPSDWDRADEGGGP